MPVGDLGGFQEPVGTRDNKINTIVFFHCCVKNHLDHLQVKKSISNAAERHIRKYKKKKKHKSERHKLTIFTQTHRQVGS